MNGKAISNIPEQEMMGLNNIYLTNIGSIQSLGYKFIIDSLRRKKIMVTTKLGKVRDMPSFENMDAFGYTLLQMPLEALNIIYPIDHLKHAVKYIIPIADYEEHESSTPPLSSTAPSTEPSVKGKDVVLMQKDSSEYTLSPEHLMVGGEPADEGDDGVGINANASTINSDVVDDPGHINAHDLTGHRGLFRLMTFIDSKNPPEKGSFEYKPATLKNNWNIFSPKEIGKYSSKIKNICNSIATERGDHIKVSDGIILIYSQWIDGGLIPMALALEEMGFTRFGGKNGNNKSLFKSPPCDPVNSITMLPRKKEEQFQPVKYIMITGDRRISPDNDFDIKAITNDNNKDGHKIKVVLISKSGSEGIDLKFIRQVHILEPWYNMNRLEQIIGRAVRNFSHKDLDFEKRNVQIFMHGTILDNNEEESADIYVYRSAEKKAILIGEVSRVLKENAVDCIINHDQINFTQENMNMEVKQILSTGQIIDEFKVGDAPYSAACDYMATCTYKCTNSSEVPIQIKEGTYTESFITMNSDKILQKIRRLMKDRFFYKKEELIKKINIPKSYPRVQIFAALTQLIDDSNEFITDKYGRTGYLVNIGDYYLFQPSELNDTKIPISDRSVPIDYKHEKIIFNVNPPANERADERADERDEELEKEAKAVEIYPKFQEKINAEYNLGITLINELKENYDLAIRFMNCVDCEKIKRGDDNWYKHCGITMRKLTDDSGINISEIQCSELLIEHIVDMLIFHEKLLLLKYIYIEDESVVGDEDISEDMLIFKARLKQYTDSKLIVTKKIKGMMLYSKNTMKMMILQNNGNWINAEPEDERELLEKIAQQYKENNYENYNTLVGFVGHDNKNKYLVFKIKNTVSKRNTGARCDEAAKTKKIEMLNSIFGKEDKYTQENTKGMVQSELCSLQELILRHFNNIRANGKVWFLDFEMAMLLKF